MEWPVEWRRGGDEQGRVSGRARSQGEGAVVEWPWAEVGRGERGDRGPLGVYASTDINGPSISLLFLPFSSSHLLFLSTYLPLILLFVSVSSVTCDSRT
jgi:hypothetical protein